MSDDEKDEQFYRDTESIAFPKLDDRQISQLAALGRCVVVIFFLRRGNGTWA